MNANQHYRRALGLLGKQGEPQDGALWPTGDSVRAQWHLAMGLALEGAERTAGADRAQRESVKALTGFTDTQIDDLGGFPDVEDVDLSNGTEPPPSRATIESIMRVVDGPAYPEGPLDRLDPEET